MKTESELFWQSVRELAAMRAQIPAERRQMSGVRMLIRDEQASRAKQSAEPKSSKR
jgi:hypothetical protein